MTLTPDQREALRQKVMAEMSRRMPIISKRFNDWRDWPGTWAFADVAVAALQEELTRGVPPSQDERTRQFFADVASSPEKARAFLQDAGILDERGELAEPYRADGVTEVPRGND